MHWVRFIGLLALLVSATHAYPQGLEVMEEDSTETRSKLNLQDRLFTGGNLGAQFGYYTFVNVSPMLGYKVSDRYIVGIRGTYQYFSIRNTDWDSHVLGGSVFNRFFVFENLFAHAEYEVLNGFWDPSGRRSNIPHFFVGGGYLYRMGGGTSLSVMALYELIQRTYSPYINPIIRVGFNVRL
ncbi:MAG: hypothetical protein GWP27_10310 [Bacteroidetes bacterium]|nr:hypothetical protein [Bacteroidota bacterium]